MDQRGLEAGFVMVPVPVDRVLDVYALIVERNPTGDPGSRSKRDWSREMLELVLADVSPTIWFLARFLADHPDQEVTTDEAAAALRLPAGWNSLAGALGSFRRYLNNRGLDLPWEVGYGSDDRVRMRMDSTTAETIRSIKRPKQ